MNKADKKSKQYRDFREQCGINDRVMLNEIEEAYYEGYNQAEKDMELTWEDLQLICKIEFSICYYEYKGKKLPPQEQVYKEILKRFKDFKEGK